MRLHELSHLLERDSQYVFFTKKKSQKEGKNAKALHNFHDSKHFALHC